MLVFEAGWNESLVWRQRGWGSTDDPFNSACLIYELSFMGEEAADAQSQLGHLLVHPWLGRGDTVGRVLLPLGLLFSLLPGAGEAATCWCGLWGLSAAGLRCPSHSPQSG